MRGNCVGSTLYRHVFAGIYCKLIGCLVRYDLNNPKPLLGHCRIWANYVTIAGHLTVADSLIRVRVGDFFMCFCRATLAMVHAMKDS